MEPFQLFDGDTMIAEGCFSPLGFASPDLANPLTEDSRLRITDVESGMESVEGIPNLPFGNVPNVEIKVGNDDALNVGVKIEQNPELSIRIDYIDIELGAQIDSLSDAVWTSLESRFPDRAGTGFFGIPGTESRVRLFRGVSAPATELDTNPDNFDITPGSVERFDVSKNDNVPPAARYILVDPPIPFGNPERAFTEVGFKFSADGSFHVAMPTFASELSFSYRASVGDFLGPITEVKIFPGTDQFRTGTPRGIDLVGSPLVEVTVLEIGGEWYPAYQFFLGPQEPIDLIAMKGCPEMHWHGGPAYPLFGSPGAPAIIDVRTQTCGFGTLTDLPLKEVIILTSVWEGFRNAHP